MALIADGLLFKPVCCHESCHITAIRELHLLLTVHPVDNYPGRLICSRDEPSGLFGCVELQPSVSGGKSGNKICIDAADLRYNGLLKGRRLKRNEI